MIAGVVFVFVFDLTLDQERGYDVLIKVHGHKTKLKADTKIASHRNIARILFSILTKHELSCVPVSAQPIQCINTGTSQNLRTCIRVNIYV